MKFLGFRIEKKENMVYMYYIHNQFYKLPLSYMYLSVFDLILCPFIILNSCEEYCVPHVH